MGIRLVLYSKYFLFNLYFPTKYYNLVGKYKFQTRNSRKQDPGVRTGANKLPTRLLLSTLATHYQTFNGNWLEFQNCTTL